VSHARFESKLMQASTAYRMTAYRQQSIRLDRASSQLPLGKTESAQSHVIGKRLKLKRFHALRPVPRLHVEPRRLTGKS
jgi:hypothetical protein